MHRAQAVVPQRHVRAPPPTPCTPKPLHTHPHTQSHTHTSTMACASGLVGALRASMPTNWMARASPMKSCMHAAAARGRGVHGAGQRGMRRCGGRGARAPVDRALPCTGCSAGGAGQRAKRAQAWQLWQQCAPPTSGAVTICRHACSRASWSAGTPPDLPPQYAFHRASARLLPSCVPCRKLSSSTASGVAVMAAWAGPACVGACGRALAAVRGAAPTVAA